MDRLRMNIHIYNQPVSGRIYNELLLFREVWIMSVFNFQIIYVFGKLFS